jgi:acyl-coenzyme A thioesterase 13
MVHKEFGDIFKRFISIPILKNTFAEHFYQGFTFLPGHALERNTNHLVLRYKVP